MLILKKVAFYFICLVSWNMNDAQLITFLNNTSDAENSKQLFQVEKLNTTVALVQSFSWSMPSLNNVLVSRKRKCIIFSKTDQISEKNNGGHLFLDQLFCFFVFSYLQNIPWTILNRLCFSWPKIGIYLIKVLMFGSASYFNERPFLLYLFVHSLKQTGNAFFALCTRCILLFWSSLRRTVPHL